MANFVSNYCLGPVAPMVQRDKGNVANRAACTREQTKEFVKTGIKATVITAPILATGHFIANAEKANAGRIQQGANKLFTTVFNKAKELFNKENVKEVITSVKNTIKNMPPAMKGGLIVLAGLACVAKAVALVVGHKHMYTTGQIDQKYTDRAEQQGKQPPHGGKIILPTNFPPRIY